MRLLTGLVVGILVGITASAYLHRAWCAFLHYLFSRGDQ